MCPNTCPVYPPPHTHPHTHKDVHRYMHNLKFVNYITCLWTYLWILKYIWQYVFTTLETYLFSQHFFYKVYFLCFVLKTNHMILSPLNILLGEKEWATIRIKDRPLFFSEAKSLEQFNLIFLSIHVTILFSHV